MISLAQRNLFFFIFALSGFSGLIYESIWTHYLKLFLGHAAYAQTLVLAIFMGGMAIGSWVCSRYSPRWNNLLLVYALIEAIIGVLALLFHDVFDASIQYAYATILPNLDSPTLVSSFKWISSAFIILPQSILLGMTFPLMSAGVIRSYPDKPGQSVSMLYFSNSIGASIGVLVSGFILIEWVGLPGTIRTAGAMNILLAITVWYLARQQNIAYQASQLPPDTDTNIQKPHWYRLLLSLALFTGLASFIYEIAWIRMLSLVLGSSTHAFELMLSAFILGLALGGLWIKRRIDQLKSPIVFLAIVQLVMGLLALITLPLYNQAFDIMHWLVNNLDKTEQGYTWFNLSSHAIAIVIMLPTTVCAGMTLPLITTILMRNGHGEKSIGSVYAFNTIGAIVGVFFAVHIGLPLFGLKYLLCFGAAIDIALAILLIYLLDSDKKQKLLKTVSIAGIAGLSVSIAVFNLDPYKMLSGVYRQGKIYTADDVEILYHRDGKTSTVDLHRDKDNFIAIRTNGKVDATINMSTKGHYTRDEPTMILAGAAPLLHVPNAKSAAVIGLGSGLSTHTLLASSTLEVVDTIEIEPSMVEAAKFFQPNVDRTYKDPRSKLYIDDAKTYFSTHNKRYDIILSEPSNPWVSGVSSLFTKEFYRTLKNYISKEGVLVQWIQLYELNLELVASISKALSLEFSDYVIYACTDTDIIIIAKPTGKLNPPDISIFNNTALAADLKAIDIHNINDFLVRRVGAKQYLQVFLNSYNIKANSDYYPVLDLGAVRSRFMNTIANDLQSLTYSNIPALRILEKQGNTNGFTQITNSAALTAPMFANIATVLRDYYLVGNRQNVSLPKKYSTLTYNMNSYLDNCEIPNTNQWINTLINLSGAMTPFLSVTELQNIWQKIKSKRCFNKLSDPQKDWFELIYAVNVRNASKMSGIANWLLKHSIGSNNEHFNYLISAALLGELMQNKKQNAQLIWGKYKHLFTTADSLSNTTQFLLAQVKN